MIAEHPAYLEEDSVPVRIQTRPFVGFPVRINGHRTTGNLKRNLGQATRLGGLGVGDEQDRRDMLGLVAGHDEALQSLMGRHKKTLYSQLLRMLRDKMDAQDSLLEAFVRVFLHREGFEFERRFSTWLYAIAFNLARDYLRRRSRQPEFISLDDRTGQESGDLDEALLDPHRTPDQEMENQERLVSLGKALKSLPDCLREPLMLFALEEKSQPQIAAEMQCSVKAVEMRLYHARKRLHDVLGKEFRKTRDSAFCGVIAPEG